MSDNTTLNSGTGGDVIATDEIAGVKFQRVKLTLGADGTNDGDVASGNPVPVSAGALPLPTGAATAALQLPDSHNVTVDNAAAGAAVNIQDGGNTITVDGAVTVSATNLDVRDLTHVSDSVRIGDGTDLALVSAAGALLVDGSATTQPISGTVTANPATAYGKTITYVAVAQGAAGTTVLAAADASNKHKIIGGMLTMSLAGTLKFNDGVADLTGPMTFAANGGMVVPESPVPFCQTGAVNRAMNLITTVGNANGVIAILTEP